MEAEADGVVPPYRDAHRLVAALEALINEPPTRRGPAALVILDEQPPGDAANQLLHGLRQRFLGADGRLVPYAWIDAGPTGAADGVDPAVAMFERIVDDLGKLPRHAGRLRLRQFTLLRNVARAAGLPTSPQERVDELRTRLYERRRPHGAGDGPQPDGLPWWQSMVWWSIKWCAPGVFAWRVNRRMTGRRAWFSGWARRRAGGDAGRDFYSDAAKLAPGGEGAGDVGEVLMWALLADLDAALRWPRLSPWRARRTRFVLFAPPVQAAAGGPPDGTAKLVDAYRSAAEDMRSRGTVLVAPAGPGETQSSGDFLEAAQTLEESPRRHGGPLEVAVAVPPLNQADDGGAERAFRYQRRIQPRRQWRWPPRVHVGVRAVGMALALAGALAGLGLAGVPVPPFSDGSCPDGQVEEPEGSECLGLSSGDAYFDGMAGEFTPLFDMVADTNKEVDALADEDRPVRTVVYFGHFHSELSSVEVMSSDVVAELRGVALAHQVILEEAKSNHERVALRLLLANAGPSYRDAALVADLVVEQAESEPIIGVVGPRESRAETFEALRVLGDADLPTVGTAATADALRDQSLQFYQLAPTNDRQAQVAAEFLEHEELFTAASEDGLTEAAAVIYDPDDPYSDNLAQDFADHFGNGPVELLRHGAPGSDGAGEAEETFRALAQEVCDRLAEQPRTVVFWAGRQSDLTAFVDEFGLECSSPITVLGADTIASNLGDERNLLDEHSELTLYYLAHGFPAASNPPSGLPERFVEAYQREFFQLAATGPEALESGDAALGWDALYVLAEAAKVAYGGNVTDFDNAAVVTALNSEQVSFQGVTGLLSFHEDRMPPDKPVYILQARETIPLVVLQCGAFTAEEVWLTWGNGYPCPHD